MTLLQIHNEMLDFAKHFLNSRKKAAIHSSNSGKYMKKDVIKSLIIVV